MLTGYCLKHYTTQYALIVLRTRCFRRYGIYGDYYGNFDACYGVRVPEYATFNSSAKCIREW